MHYIPTTGRYGQNYLLTLNLSSICKQTSSTPQHIPLFCSPFYAAQDHTLLLSATCPSLSKGLNKGSTKWSPGKELQSYMDFSCPATIAFSTCCGLREERTLRITSTKPSQHTAQAPVLCVLRLPPQAAHSVPAVWKQQNKSQIPREAAVSYLHYWALLLTSVFQVSIERPKGNFAALWKQRTQLYLSHTTKGGKCCPLILSPHHHRCPLILSPPMCSVFSKLNNTLLTTR